MEIKDNGISHVKQTIRSVNELEVAPEDWSKERRRLIESLHDEVGDTSFRQAIEDLRVDAWDKPWTREARVIAQAAEMYDIPFGKASRRRLMKNNTITEAKLNQTVLKVE